MSVYGEEYESMPLNDRFELMTIAESVFHGGKVTWKREFYESIKDYEPGEVLSFMFTLRFTNSANVPHKVKFSVHNYQKLKKIEFERIARGITSFLEAVNNIPLEVEVEVKVGGLVGARNRGLVIRVNSAGGGFKKLFTIGEFVKFKPYNPYSKYIFIFQRNPKAFGLTKVTPDKVRMLGFNPNAIFNSDGVPVNTGLYREVREKLINQRMFNFSYTLFKVFFDSLKTNKSLFAFMDYDDIATSLCAQNLADSVCENSNRDCTEKVKKYLKGVFTEVIEKAGDKEYWKSFGQYFYPICVEAKRTVEVLYRPEMD